uniref:NADH dehydrogenase subunit 4L n=1 Tax=Ibla cumingi TaxID=58185 RepID=UPI0021CCD9ED|nr:NADH dehydrogenase subunit 4L [Ibla cumingi]UWM12943.1 NADH dehydrogenase subunit 4L [Ibla cumingi]
MVENYMLLSLVLYLGGFWVFVSKRKHLMNMLISLEYLVLSIFLLLVMATVSLGLDMYVGLLYLVAAVCEGSLGVGVMVSLVRSHGSDYMDSLSVLKC